MSSYLNKTSPFAVTTPSSSSSYGQMYSLGNNTTNNYSSYFGPPPSQQPSAPLGSGDSFSQSHNFSSPYSPSSFITSPTSGRPPLGISGGCSPFITPVPAQTQIIGGLNNSQIIGSEYIKEREESKSKKSGYSSPGKSGGRSQDNQSEPMHCSPLGINSLIPLPSSNTNYLPCYFLGLDQQHYQGGMMSPIVGCGPYSSVNSISPSSFMSPQRNFKKSVRFEPTLGAGESDENNGEGVINSNENSKAAPPAKKLPGPPIHGFGSDEAATPQTFMESVLSQSMASSFESPQQQLMQVTPTSSKGPGKCWVTIFGFPAGANSFIVNNFSTLGNILEVKCTPGSNWLHIRFSNPIEARRAICKNGKVLGQSIMVGVIPSDDKIIEEAENANLIESEKANKSMPLNQSPYILKERNVNHSSTDTPTTSRIRPLARGFYSSNMNSPSHLPSRILSDMPSISRERMEVQPNSERRDVPAPTTGIITKAIEFMFGW